MKNIFNANAPLMRKLAQIPDLIVLNLIWMVCCLPVITVGAATTALHTVTQAYTAGEENGIFRPFFRSFRSNFRQSTLLWLPIAGMIAVLAVDFLYLAANGTGVRLLLWLPFLIIGTIVIVITVYGFPLIARYNNDTKTIISNAFLLFSLHFFPSLGVMALHLIPWVLLIVNPNIFLRTSPVWLLAGGSLIAYIADHVLLPIFKKYDPPAEET